MECDVEKHWFAFSYTGSCLETGKTVSACTYTGYLERNINLARIAENKVNAGVSEDSVLVAVSYLGCMTREEMTQQTLH